MGTLHGGPGSDESLALIKGWIDDCQRHHQLCMKMPQQVGRPKRLLQCLSHDSARLVETTQRCDYIALSYCWGDGKAVLKTTEKTTEEAPKTLDRHQSGILDKDLPPLYQEVVALARRLNVGLWIDAVCIIQDSHFFPGAISNTHIARRAWCFQEKLLASRCLVFCEDEVVWECRSCCLCECGGEQEHFTQYLRSTMLRYQQWLLPLAEHDTLTAFAQLPFAEHEPFLDGSLTAFAELPFAEHEPFLDGSLTAFAELPFAEHEPLQLDGTLKYFVDTEAAYSFWESTVKDYSERALSFQTDRLPAIFAVASIVGSHWRSLLGWTVERRPASWVGLVCISNRK